MPSNTSSRSPSKRKLVHSSLVSVETTPEPVPHKKNKTTLSHTGSSPKVSVLMPAVSITYVLARLACISGLSLKHKVLYGKLSAKEVESVVAPSDIDDADLSASSLKRHGHVLFVDDKASEASQASEEPSADEDSNRTNCEPESDIDAVVQPSRSLSKVKTVKGSYVEDLLQSGNADDVKSDPTLTS
ncbi:hypothetical protein IW261DRAFT_1572108 [Armillaria novae-zelandiae]|uniref:Uncharacterized protein n=1 Tax=Armillaria novae-zelandiae TaxID=153914 RepID=A0AA39TVN9_9AGAR|nr:hypothetical protein IW261DRAFT_1572108 [Armillaria novae-zelandiae]